MSVIGVLALQGGYAAHGRSLRALGHEVVEVRYAEQFQAIDGLVFPGGESSTNILLMERFGLWKPLVDFYKTGKPVFTTCAGLILVAAEVKNPEQKSFGWIDVAVVRNGWGRQLDSFKAVADDGETPLLFIRAPKITRVGDGVEVLCTYKDEPIMVRQGNVTGATFHPELTDHLGIHEKVFSRA